MTLPKDYVKQPVQIQAMQLAGSTAETHAAYLWIEENTLGSFEPMAVIDGDVPAPESGVSIDPRDGRLMIATLEGVMWADYGDWIIRGIQGEFYPCKPDIFAATYNESEGEAIAAFKLPLAVENLAGIAEGITEIYDTNDGKNLKFREQEIAGSNWIVFTREASNGQE